jgi:hypothetical protein
MKTRARDSSSKRCLWGVMLAAAWVAGGVAGGCTSRTVPLPPPTVDYLSMPDDDGMVTVRGLAHEGAGIGVINDRTLEGVVVTSPDDDCGNACRWEARVAAEIGDPLRVWQFFETESSRHVEVPNR